MGKMRLIQLATQSIKDDEGRVLYAYQDSEGYWTIGDGHLIDKRRGGGISRAIADAILREDILAHIEWLSQQAFFRKCNETRQVLLVNMCHNLGRRGLLKFKRMIAAIYAEDWGKAADEILDSVAAHKLKVRYQRLANQMRVG